ncbi:hypothetical protein DFS34DRAFT_685194 [Phlyctochytrium arcticum]|nr:hypothetical protein DFS34DRAFT_685194 [Phlyctochytrium arcticum]
MSGYYDHDPNAAYYAPPQLYTTPQDPQSHSTTYAAPPQSYPSYYAAPSTSYPAPSQPYRGSSSNNSVPYPTGYVVESTTGAVPYPAGYTPTASTANIVKVSDHHFSNNTVSYDEGRKAAALAALPSMSAVGKDKSAGGETDKGKKRKTILRSAGGEAWEDPTLMEWDQNDFRLFIGDLGNEVTDELLHKSFSKYPTLLKARIVRDKRTAKSMGYGFVSFKDPNDFVKASREMNGKYVGNRPIKIRKSNWKDRNVDLKTLRKMAQTSIVKPVIKRAPGHK